MSLYEVRDTFISPHWWRSLPANPEKADTSHAVWAALSLRAELHAAFRHKMNVSLWEQALALAIPPVSNSPHQVFPVTAHVCSPVLTLRKFGRFCFILHVHFLSSSSCSMGTNSSLNLAINTPSRTTRSDRAQRKIAVAERTGTSNEHPGDHTSCRRTLHPVWQHTVRVELYHFSHAAALLVSKSRRSGNLDFPGNSVILLLPWSGLEFSYP